MLVVHWQRVSMALWRARRWLWCWPQGGVKRVEAERNAAHRARQYDDACEVIRLAEHRGTTEFGVDGSVCARCLLYGDKLDKCEWRSVYPSIECCLANAYYRRDIYQPTNGDSQ